MKFVDQGIILFSRKLQEKLLLVKIFSAEHGICTGVVKAVLSRKNSDYQVGNLIKFQKYSRLNDQLGTISGETIKSLQWIIMSDPLKLYGFNSICSLLLSSFAESEPHLALYASFENFMKALEKEKFSWLSYCALELELLKEAGYGLELEKCAVSKKTDDLQYVSPKTGRAVSRDAAKGYEHLLLKLPSFIVEKKEPESSNEIKEALALSEYFFERYIWRQAKLMEIFSARDTLKTYLK